MYGNLNVNFPAIAFVIEDFQSTLGESFTELNFYKSNMSKLKAWVLLMYVKDKYTLNYK